MSIANGCVVPTPEAEIARFLRMINEEGRVLLAELEVLVVKLQPVLGDRPVIGDSAEALRPADSPIGIELRSHLSQLEYLRRSVTEIHQTLAI